jgi:hypothetical protein
LLFAVIRLSFCKRGDYLSGYLLEILSPKLFNFPKIERNLDPEVQQPFEVEAHPNNI